MGLTSKNKSYSINISIPSQNECKKLTVSEHELIHCIKQKILNESPETTGNLTNNGLLLVSKKKDIKRFLNENDEIGDLRKYASDFRLEFVPKYKIQSEEEARNSISLNTTDIQKKFIENIKNNQDDKVKDILELGVDPNFLTENGETPLSLCIFKNKVDLIKLLIDKGAYTDYKIPRGKNWITYLQYAIICQNFESIKLLIEKGIWIEDTDKLNRTALFYAIKVQNVEYVSYLLKIGASIQCVDSKGYLPIHYACKKGNEQIVLYLIDYGSDLNFVDSNGNTPIHIAMKYNYKECVRWLLVRGSRKDLPNNEGQKPVDINRSNNCNEELIKMVGSFDCTNIVPPPPKFSLLSDDDKGKEKKKSGKKRRSAVVKIPPPPPLFTPKMGSDLFNGDLFNLQRSRSSSSPSIIPNARIRLKLEKASSNKNIYNTVGARPYAEPNNRSPLRGTNSNDKLGSFTNIYDSSIYSPNSVSMSSSPLSRSIEIDISPKTAVNPEDQPTPSVDTPRTAVDSSSKNNLLRSLGNLNKNSSSVFNSSSGIISNNNNGNSLNSSMRSLNQDKEKEKEKDNENENDTDNGNKHKSGDKNNLPKIETTKLALKNLGLSNPNVSAFTDSPRSAIYVPSPRKGSNRFLHKNADFSSASSILNAFIKNDTSTILDNILNIDNEEDDDEDSIDEINKDLDVTKYDYSSECQSEDNPNLALINKEFNNELLEYLKGLDLVNEGEIVGVDPEISKKPTQRNKLFINSKDYQNANVNNKELLLETYEKLYLILEDIQKRSIKAKESIKIAKEEHSNLIEEIKIVREKEMKLKGSNKAMTSITELDKE